MRMRFLLVAALGLGLTYGVAGLLLTPYAPPPGPPPLAFPALAARIATADRVELVHGGAVVWLERRGQVWGLARQGGYPARADLTNALIAALTTMRLLTPAPGTPAALGLADPFAAGPASGTFVRVWSNSGATLCTVIVGPPGTAVVRRPNDEQAWTANNPLTVPAGADGWSQHALPPLDPANIRAVLNDGGLGAGTVEKALAGLPFTDVGLAAQHHPAPLRVLQVGLATGSAVLTVGKEGGQVWLLVSGTAPWASRLAPYAFALPASSPLVEF